MLKIVRMLNEKLVDAWMTRSKGATHLTCHGQGLIQSIFVRWLLYRASKRGAIKGSVM